MSRVIQRVGLSLILSLTGCTVSKAPYDYTAFKQSDPKSILVLLPENRSLDIKASHSLLSHVTYPLAEAGYYVLPVAVVEETFRQNGLTMAQDMRAVSSTKLQQIFGADALLYLDIKEYGTQYQVISSNTRVTADAKLIDLKSGQLLWNGSATASTSEQDSNSGGSIVGLLVQAAISQIANTVMDKGHDIAKITSYRLLSAGQSNGILYGPRSPLYSKDKT